jgi:hypothetical protein
MEMSKLQQHVGPLGGFLSDVPARLQLTSSLLHICAINFLPGLLILKTGMTSQIERGPTSVSSILFDACQILVGD